MDSGGSGEQQPRWRSSDARRGQGQRRNMRGDGNSYSGPGYSNQNSNGNANAWGGGGGGRNMNQNTHQHQQSQSGGGGGGVGYYEPHVSVNGFNSQEALDLLTKAYDLHIQAARSSGPDGDKPVLYKGDKGWSTPKGSNSAWGQKRNVMAGGNDFLAQLRKSHTAYQQNAGRSEH